YLFGLQARNISFRLLQGELKYFNMKSARGWTELLSDYASNNEKDIINNLKEIYLSQLNYSNRAVFFAQLNNITDAILLKKTLLNLINSNDKDYQEYIATYPLPIDSATHKKVKKLRPVCISHSQHGNSITITTTYLRPFKERSAIETNTLSPATQKELNCFDEIIGIKDRYIQCFDTITFNYVSGEITFEIDMCTNLNHNELERASTRYRRILMYLFHKENSYHVAFIRKNIFTAIDKLYKSADGTILKLGHATGTGSVKEEKMRKRKDDLRKEKYHAAGLAAIGGKTNNFSISKQWNGAHNNILTMHVPGHFSLISSSLPFINHVIIEGCVCKSDYELLMSKVF
ncbi:hypothetical protein D6W14_002446, partial [Escherichia coli]|nr:hypothetical protein [Escherichia coli]